MLVDCTANFAFSVCMVFKCLYYPLSFILSLRPFLRLLRKHTIVLRIWTISNAPRGAWRMGTRAQRRKTHAFEPCWYCTWVPPRGASRRARGPRPLCTCSWWPMWLPTLGARSVCSVPCSTGPVQPPSEVHIPASSPMARAMCARIAKQGTPYTRTYSARRVWDSLYPVPPSSSATFHV